MIKLNKHDVALYIRNQFPTAYEEGGEGFIAFVEAYYEYLDQTQYKNRTMIESVDIDDTLDEFVSHFKETYLKDFPFIAATDKKFMIKHILDFYKSKGTALSTELLIRMLYGENSKINLPSKDILRASDSEWYEPEYIEVSRSDRTITFLDTQIIGSKSKAKATVEGIVTKRVNGKYIDVVYISNVRGSFLKDEFVTNDGNLRNAPIVVGSLTSITVSNGGRNNKIGDTFQVIGASGERGKVRVVDIVGATGRVDFSIEEGGFGFTTTSDTDVYISDAILQIKNEDMMFENFDSIRQHTEELELISFDTLSANVAIGDTLIGHDFSGSQVANGVIATLTNRGDGTGTAQLIVQDGTFDTQRRLTVTGGNTALYAVGDIITEESLLTIEYNANTIPITVGQRLEQAVEVPLTAKTGILTLTTPTATNYTANEVVVCSDAFGDLVISGKVVVASSPTTLKLNSVVTYKAPNTYIPGSPALGTTSNQTSIISAFSFDPIPSLYTNKSSGVITAISGNTLTLDRVWGEIDSSKSAFLFANSTSTTVVGGCYVNAVTYDMRGAYGTLTSKTTNTLNLQGVRGEFNTGRRIKPNKSKIIRTISGVVDTGATDVSKNGNTSVMAVISSIANTSASGIVIGQNTSAVGVWGNTSPFISSGDVNIPNTSKVVEAMFASASNLVTIRTSTSHGYNINDTVNINIDLQQNNEVKRIFGLYRVLSIVDAQSFRVQMDNNYGNIIRAGGYQFFTATVVRSIIINTTTTRKDGLAFTKEVYGVASGSDANFTIGTLEGEETVFINTDFVGDTNVVDVDYLDIRIDGSESGIGFVGAVRVNTPGSGYANGAQLTFTGGGFANGDPDITAVGAVMTNANGSVIDVQILDMGQGYYSSPVITLPATSGTPATVTPLMEYGYGFPKLPTGGIENYLEDLWTSKEMTIGKISSLANINPGIGYDANPFVLVYNSYIAGFKRTDKLIVSSEGTSMYVVGEIVSQQISGDGGSIITPKGYVSAIQGNTVFLNRMSFNTSFTAGFPLTGETSGAMRYVQAVEELSGALVLGDNAIIPAVTIAADGIATELEVIDSGFGYVHNQPVTLFNENTPFVLTGNAVIRNHGRSEGTWKSETSHLDGNSRIHDNNYYQEFSYEVITGRSMDAYKNILKDISHVAGTKMFGKVERNDYIDLSVKKTTANIMRGVDNYSSVSSKLIGDLYSNGERGVVLWPSYNNWYSDLGATDKIIRPNEDILVWKSSKKEKLTKRKNLITWSNRFDMSVWTKTGVAVTSATDSVLAITATNSIHSLSTSFETKPSTKYTFSAYIKSSNHNRITLRIRGAITSGYVTFDIINGSIVAQSGGYTGRVESSVNGFVRIVIIGDRAISYEGTSYIDLICNTPTGMGAQVFDGTAYTSSDILIKNFQIETGIIASPYQDVTHGDEWVGVKFYQNKGGEYAPKSARMPINGIKNFLNDSDNFDSPDWIFESVTVEKSGTIMDQDASILRDTRDIIPTKHTLKKRLPKPCSTFGAVLKSNETSRYVQLSALGKVAVFDLFSNIVIRSSFPSANIIEEDGNSIVSIFDSNLHTNSFRENTTVEITMLNSSEIGGDTYIGTGSNSLGILRAFAAGKDAVDVFEGYTQKNVNDLNVSDTSERDILYVSFGNQDERLISPIYESYTGQVVIGGINGVWIEDYSGSNEFNSANPDSYEIMKALGGIIGLVQIDRQLSEPEINNVVNSFELGGSKGLFVENVMPSIDDLGLADGNDETTITNTIIGKTEGSVAQANLYAQSGLYRLVFDYRYISRNVTSFRIVEKLESGNVRTIKEVPLEPNVGEFEDYIYIENDNFAFVVESEDNGDVVEITNMAAYLHTIS